MSKKLEILIPHYKEKADEVRPLLDSIAIQQNVNFNEIGVIICHDGPEAHDFSFMEPGIDDGIVGEYMFPITYPFEIKQIRQEHKGASAARNTCLDAATADYGLIGLLFQIVLQHISNKNGGLIYALPCFS